MSSVSSEEVAEYWPLVEAYARRFERVGEAEFDDLVQEGVIAVWQSLEQGHVPSGNLIKNSMRDWIRYISHRGLAYGDSPLEG